MIGLQRSAATQRTPSQDAAWNALWRELLTPPGGSGDDERRENPASVAADRGMDHHEVNDDGQEQST